jgi:ribosomal protein L40E
MSERVTGPYRDHPDGEPRPTRESDADKKIALYTRIGLPLGTFVIAMIAGSVQGPPAAVLVLAGGALIGVIALFWASVRTLIGETPLSGADAYALGAPRAEEEQKRSVLRALKDLEFERSVGKISDEDYQALTAKYRAEAKRLLRVLDEEAGPRRAHVETMVAKRLRREGLAEGGYRDEIPPAPETAEDEAPKAAEEAPKAAEAKPAFASAGKGKKRKKGRDATPAASDGESETRTCTACRTKNDPDAVFCKKCGAKQEQAS